MPCSRPRTRWPRPASMGPRSRERGNEGPGWLQSIVVALQWGRAHVSAEMQVRCLLARAKRALQWGRAHVSAEMVPVWRQALASVTDASMGPRSRERGNAAQRSDPAHQAMASMGPRSRERGNHAVDDVAGARVNASMGPRSRERGNSLSHLVAGRAARASMGPRSRERGNRARLCGVATSISMLQWGRAHVSAEILP